MDCPSVDMQTPNLVSVCCHTMSSSTGVFYNFNLLVPQTTTWHNVNSRYYQVWLLHSAIKWLKTGLMTSQYIHGWFRCRYLKLSVSVNNLAFRTMWVPSFLDTWLLDRIHTLLLVSLFGNQHENKLNPSQKPNTSMQRNQ